MNDLVSVIMPSYNTAKYIKASIDSVLNQTYENLELIIVDDCSSDNTEEIIKSYTDKRIKFHKNDKNSGAAVSRNKALAMANGRWIAFLDSDDLWHPQKLEKQIAFMQINGYAFSYTEYEEIYENGDKSGKIISGPEKITKRGMFNYCWPGCLTVMYDANSIGLVQIENIKKNNDYAMWLVICKKTNCYLLKKNLAEYRKGRSGSISTNGYITLVKWHYRLFRICEKQNVILSVFNTFRNLFFGFVKKIKFTYGR